MVIRNVSGFEATVKIGTVEKGFPENPKVERRKDEDLADKDICSLENSEEDSI